MCYLSYTHGVYYPCNKPFLYLKGDTKIHELQVRIYFDTAPQFNDSVT